MQESELDFYLNKVIELQKAQWHHADTGVGAACLLVPSRREVLYDTCRDVGHNTFAHAEHNVIQAYIERHGQNPPAESILITTIAPCANPNSAWRVGDSCRSLIEQSGIRRVYAGVSVETDTPSSHFDLTVTQNARLAEICKNLHGLFNIKAARQADGSPARLVTAYKSKAVFERVFKGSP